MMMVRKLLVLVVAVTAVSTAVGAPQPYLEFGFDNQLNDFLQTIEAELIPQNPLVIQAYQEGVADIYIEMNDVTITGVNNFISSGSQIVIEPLTDVTTCQVNIKSPKVTLNIGNYFIEGKMVDHIPLWGEGPGTISVDDMQIMLMGKVSEFNISQTYIVFEEASIDLEMDRWTINLEGLMPGTDLGTVFNEFFTMCGPEIFDTIEKNLNNSDKVLNYLNSLFPKPEETMGSDA